MQHWTVCCPSAAGARTDSLDYDVLDMAEDAAATANLAKQVGSVSAAQEHRQRLYKHVQPKGSSTFGNLLQRSFLNSWINVLILAAPIGVGLNFVPGVSPIAVFLVNFVAILPLAAVLSFATEEIALRAGETLGGLLNATFGNAVELIVAVTALARTKITIAQTSLVGSSLSNLLLIMGMCFFLGGLHPQNQPQSTVIAQTAAGLLVLAGAAVIVPWRSTTPLITPLARSRSSVEAPPSSS